MATNQALVRSRAQMRDREDVVTIVPLAGDPGLIGTSARTVDISRAYWSRRTGVKAARPASQNSRSSRNSFSSGAFIPARALRDQDHSFAFPRKAQSACSAVRAAHQPSPDDSSISTSPSSGSGGISIFKMCHAHH